jgi:hypothetical protein
VELTFIVTEIENYSPERLRWKMELKRRSAEVEVEVPDAIKAVVGYVK